MKFRITVALIVFFLLTISLSPANAQPRDVFKTKLDNGMTVILEEDHSARVVAFQMYVRVGGADESDKEAGISHVLEHMLFKRNEKRKLGEISGGSEGAR